MKLYIQVDENGQCMNHPALEENLLHALGSIPDHWEPFERIPQNITVNRYQNAVCSYQKIDGVWKDVWTAEEKSDAEKSIIKQKIIEEANQQKQAALSSATDLMSLYTDPDALAALQTYIDELNAWVLVDELNPNFPEYPKLPELTTTPAP